MIRYAWTFPILLCVGLMGCSGSSGPMEGDYVVARVGDAKLTLEDLEGINFGGNPKDSLSLLQAYASKWMHEQVLYQKAQQELAGSSSVFDKQLEAYRKSLFVYSYEQQVVGESMDTSISIEQVQEYYRQNEKHFLLKSDILKFRLAVFPLKTKVPAKIKALFVDGTSRKLPSLESFLGVKAKSFILNDTTWMAISDVDKLLPEGYDIYEERLKRNGFYEFQDSTGMYWFWIRDLKIKKTISPLEFEIPRIRAILLHQKKQAFLNEQTKKWVQEALTSKTAEIYVQIPEP